MTDTVKPSQQEPAGETLILTRIALKIGIVGIVLIILIMVSALMAALLLAASDTEGLDYRDMVMMPHIFPTLLLLLAQLFGLMAIVPLIGLTLAAIGFRRGTEDRTKRLLPLILNGGAFGVLFMFAIVETFNYLISPMINRFMYSN